jgi:DNA (cytosine-5)-methyltransferase 1
MNYSTFFSGAGIGCHGLKINGLECILSNEYLEERMAIQRFNDKCSDEDRYIVGDIREPETRKKIELILKQVRDNEGLDVLIATPPCQGISLANHKKTPTEIVRNSLILESILLTKKFQPKYFIYENVLGFLSSACSDSDGYDREVVDVIDRHLKKSYSIEKFVFNLKHFSIPSSRTRTVVVGARKDLNIHPLSIFPKPEKVVTLKDSIGHLKSLKNPREFDPEDPLHFYRPYDERMLPWIENTKEGQSAFDQKDKSRIPNQVIDGILKINESKNGDKYKRQKWDDIGPCIHTRSDTFSSQNTIHPKDNRVFSIRELMILMSIPKTFRWVPKKVKLDTYEEVKKYELNIRKAIGESFPTRYLQLLSKNILRKHFLSQADVETINRYFLETQMFKRYSIELQESKPLSAELKETIEKCIFYNRLEKNSANPLKICIGNDHKETKADIIFSTRKIDNKIPILELDKFYLYQLTDKKNLSLF